jgi:hypothetical protein
MAMHPTVYSMGEGGVIDAVNGFGQMDALATQERKRGLYARTPLALGETCIASPLLESNARHAFVLVMRACGRKLTMENFLEHADDDVYDAFVELVAGTITIAQQQQAKTRGTTFKKQSTDNGARIADVVSRFTLLYIGKDGEFHIGCPDVTSQWDPVSSGYSFGFGVM